MLLIAYGKRRSCRIVTLSHRGSRSKLSVPGFSLPALEEVLGDLRIRKLLQHVHFENIIIDFLQILKLVKLGVVVLLQVLVHRRHQLTGCLEVWTHARLPQLLHLPFLDRVPLLVRISERVLPEELVGLGREDVALLYYFLDALGPTNTAPRTTPYLRLSEQFAAVDLLRDELACIDSFDDRSILPPAASLRREQPEFVWSRRASHTRPMHTHPVLPVQDAQLVVGEVA